MKTKNGAANYEQYLSTAHMVLPLTLLSILLLISGVRSFLRMMDNIQSQGFVPTEEDYHPAAALDASPDGAGDDSIEDDHVTPVIVKIVSLRRNLVLGLFYAIAVTYALGGAVDIVSTLIENSSTLPFDRGVYNIGDLCAFSLCAVAMVLQERSSGKVCGWGRLYPRIITLLGLVGESAIMVLSIFVFKQDSNHPVPAIRIGLLSLRLLLLALLLLSQTSLLSKATFVSPSTLLPEANESTSLLAGATDYGSNSEPTKSKRTLLRSSRPPSSRPKDPKSLSLLTLVARVRLLFPYLWPKESLSLQILAVVCVSLMFLKRFVNVAVPVLFGRIIQDLVEGRSPYVDISLYVLANFLGDSNTMLYRYLWLPIDQYSERSMAIRSYECLLNLSLAYHTKRKTGEMLRILDRSDAINNFFEALIFTFLPILFDLPIAFIYLSIKFGGIIVGTVSVVAVIFVTTSVVLAESRTKLYRSLRDEDQFMRAIKTDVLLQYETVKIFTAEGFESDRLRNAMRVYQKGYWNVYSAWNSLSLIQDSISAIGLLVCAFILANRVVKGQIGVGDFVTFTSYLGQLYGPLNKIAGLYRTVMSNLVDTEQLMELLAEEKEIVDQPGATDLLIERGSPKTTIEFDNVRFSYDGKKETIKGVSFKVESGSSVALVGPSGSGKSTIIKLLYRFYELQPSQGSITIASRDIRSYTQLSLRRAIGLVPQSAALMNETIRFNIAYGGDRYSTDEEIEEAARSAAIHERILSFPEGYDTRVGERGQRLSGGEQQRVAIARVILKDAPILLLDEATSALDTTNERAIQRKLRELSEGRTTISIAHRLSTVVDCDVIHVLNDGVIVESGSHLELLAKDGEYADLWRAQIQDGEIFSTTGSGVATPVVLA